MPATLAARSDGSTVSPRSERHRDTFEAGLRSFVNEARLLARFDHPALVKVYRFWEAHGTACMVMPFYEAGTLQAAVKAMRMPATEAWLRRLLTPLCDALAMLHAANCYHRDISPDNILLLPPAERPLLLDFGAARRVIGGMTHSLTTILKPGYAPIEQYAEVPGLRQGPATDVYALAATVHWIITGYTPPPAVARMLDDAYEPLEVTAAGRYSPEFLRAIDRALIVRPEARTPDIQTFRSELNAKPQPVVVSRTADPESTVALPPPPPIRLQIPAASARMRRITLSVAAAAVTATAVGAMAWRARTAESPSAVSAAPTTTATPTQAPVPARPLAPEREIETVIPTPPLPDRAHTEPAPPPHATAPPHVAATDTTPARSRTPRRTAEQAAAEVRRVECARLTERGLFGEPSADKLERARRLGCS